MILNWPLQFGRRSIFRRNARKSPVVSVDSWPGPQFQPSRLDDCRLGTVARIGVLNDCSNRYLTLAPFWRGCPSTSEADVHCRSASCALPSPRRGLASDCSCRHRAGTSDPFRALTAWPRAVASLRLQSFARVNKRSVEQAVYQIDALVQQPYRQPVVDRA